MVGNACEHAETDCLVDLDVTSNYRKTINDDLDKNFYYGINIAVVNFSDQLIGDDIKKNILYNIENVEAFDRYNKIKYAYDNHKKVFDDDYTEEDFCNITSFQHKISGRKNISDTGGTGLTMLIKSLEERSDAHQCYVLSGNRSIFFLQDYLEYNNDNWIGFNEEKNYFEFKPEDDITSESCIYMPGTAYNLNFILKGEENKYE